MKLVYASRKGHVQQLVDSLNVTNTLKINDGTEVVNEDFVLVTYTDGKGIVPKTVEAFVKANQAYLKAVAVSGNKERHPDTYCAAADILAEQYGCPVLARFDGAGDASVQEAIKKAL